MMLEKLESTTLIKSLKDMKVAFDNQNFLKMKQLAHNLKGCSAYVGAYRLYYVCFYIQ